MKKIVSSLILVLLFAIPGYSQLLKPVKIDSLVTASLPVGYTEKDTLGQQIFSANSQFGYMVVLRSPNPKNTPPLKKENDLEKVLKNNVKNIQNSLDNASAQYARDTTIGALKARTFTLQTDNGQGDIQLRNIILLYTTAAVYTFEYAFPDSRTSVIGDEYKSFVNSIKLSPKLKRHSQYLSNAKDIPVAEIALFGGTGILLIIVLIAVRKRRMQLG